MDAFTLTHVSKRFASTTALSDVTVSVPRRAIVGLIGRNGSGKSTLLRHVTGLLRPDLGDCITLGVPAATLGRAELARIGVVDQHAGFIEWMRAEQLVRYVSSFYERWDRALERALMDALEIDTAPPIGALSPGHVQRLALVLATCHHPELLLLDEPLSDLDPIARQTILTLLLDRFRLDDLTVVISSHLLRDIEPVVSRIVCLHAGRVVADDDVDALRERYAEWIVTSPDGRLPTRYDDGFVLSAQGDGQRARLMVRDVAPAAEARFAAAYDATIERRPLGIEQIFPLLTAEPAARPQPRADAGRGGWR